MQGLPMLMVRDVQASSRWYRHVLQADHDHDGAEFDRILMAGTPALMLHQWAEGEHGLRAPADGGRVGDGVVLWFGLPDIEAALQRARSLGSAIVADPWWNPRARWRECTMTDPDGYAVSLYEMG